MHRVPKRPLNICREATVYQTAREQLDYTARKLLHCTPWEQPHGIARVQLLYILREQLHPTASEQLHYMYS